jgi:hypothetical protein
MIVGYMLDEHLPRWWRREIVRQYPTVQISYVGDPHAPPLQSPDPVLLQWCEGNQVILLTNNRHTMPGHLADHVAQGRHIPGIFIVNAKWPIEALAEALALIAGASFADEYRDQIRYLPMFGGDDKP